MTAAAQAFGKRLDNFWTNAETKEYLAALSQLPGIQGSMVVTIPGSRSGTWAHPKLAVFFARWLDVRFAVWCDG